MQMRKMGGMTGMAVAALLLAIQWATTQTIVSADTIFVSNEGNQTIERFTSASVGSVFAGVHNPTGLAFDATGNLYVGKQGNDSAIVRITPAGIQSVFADTNLNNPTGLAFDSSGDLYAANGPGITTNPASLRNTIVRISPDGSSSIFADTGLNGPMGLAFDQSGNLYVANYFLCTIVRFTPTGERSVFANTAMGPRGIAFDSSGDLYVACSDANIIQEFSPSGVGTVFATQGLAYPSDVAFDSEGFLYVVNVHNNTIERFNQIGLGSVYANTGLNLPSNIAIQPVPEPGTLGLLTAGVRGVWGVASEGPFLAKLAGQQPSG